MRTPLSPIAVTADPVQLGFDADRLARLDRRFDRYVEDGRLPGYLAVVARDGEVVHLAASGYEPDTLFRIYSMTKPITSVAAMALWEEGAFELTDPIARYLPEFADVRVYARGAAQKPLTVAAVEPIRVWHLLTHTAGLTYGFHHAHAVDELYRATGFEWDFPPGLDLAGCCEVWARLPLLFQPGSEWNYSVATDVLGRLVEVVVGRPLDEVLAERVLGPVGMTETTFWADDAAAPRLAPMHLAGADGRAVRSDEWGAKALRPPDAVSGGGGLISSAADYQRFAAMLLRGGELDGARILSPHTLRLMASNHLPGGADLETFGRPLFADTTFDGTGFGLGFSVVIDPTATRSAAQIGELAWGGAASSAFWVDPAEGVSGMFFTQLLPSSTHPLRSQMRQLTYQALVDPPSHPRRGRT